MVNGLMEKNRALKEMNILHAVLEKYKTESDTRSLADIKTMLSELFVDSGTGAFNLACLINDLLIFRSPAARDAIREIMLLNGHSRRFRVVMVLGELLRLADALSLGKG